jgi:hypothetical protein
MRIGRVNRVKCWPVSGHVIVVTESCLLFELVITEWTCLVLLLLTKSTAILHDYHGQSDGILWWTQDGRLSAIGFP